MKIIDFIVMGIATYRLALLLTQERGPFDVFLRIRALTGIEHDDGGVPYMIPERFWSRLLSCVWCSSVWIGFGITIIYYIFPALSIAVLLPFALSGMAIYLSKA
jgi:hypothetical protein